MPGYAFVNGLPHLNSQRYFLQNTNKHSSSCDNPLSLRTRSLPASKTAPTNSHRYPLRLNFSNSLATVCIVRLEKLTIRRRRFFPTSHTTFPHFLDRRWVKLRALKPVFKIQLVELSSIDGISMRLGTRTLSELLSSVSSERIKFSSIRFNTAVSFCVE